MKELQNQISKWGVQTHSMFEWLNYTLEELGELAKAVSELEYRNGSKEEIYNEAIQVATLSLKIAEMIKILHMSQSDYLKMKNFAKILGNVKHLNEVKELLHEDYGYYDNLIEFAKKDNNGLNLLRAAVIEKIKTNNGIGMSGGSMNINEMLRIANVKPHELKGGAYYN